MRSVTSNFDAGEVAREFLTTALLAVLFLVTGCAETTSMRTALAPPPPFVGAGESFGPEIPVAIAMMQSIQSIEPAAGVEISEALSFRERCRAASPDTTPHVGVAFGEARRIHADDISFAALHSGVDAPEMSVRVSMALPGQNRIARGCR